VSAAYIPVDLRRRVAEQSRYRCGYCLTQEAVTGIALELDHLHPRSRGGLTTEANLWSACPLCNGHKSNKLGAIDPETGAKVKLFNPRRQQWGDHFSWSEDGTRIEGKTDVGRATVVALQLNRPGLVFARRLWVSVGWHPPED